MKFRRAKGNIGGKFSGKTPPISFTTNMSSVMQKPLPRELLLSEQLLQRFDPGLISQGLDCLRPDNFWMILVSSELSGMCDEERWYGTKYKAEKFPPDFATEIKTAAHCNIQDRLPALYLPMNNLY
ncbi:Metalloenzyme, LuxS/M16 peptidase-like protein [Xylariales sp. PMI_506]|nr:Metalloenzyme, LuxS/M16 peptidase-like protein [Xylariales sp. PMI_506]